MFKIEMYYKSNKIKFIDFEKIMLSDSLDYDEDYKTIITIPYTKSNEVLFLPPFDNFTIKINDKDYTFIIIPNGIQKNDKTIRISCKPKLLNDLEVVLKNNINKTNYNPIDAVKEILTDLSIPYNSYSFTNNYYFFDSINLYCDIVFIKSNSLDVKLVDFIREVFKILAIKLCFNLESNEIYIYNPLENPNNSEFISNIVENRYIRNATLKESELKDFYNSFNIALLYNGKSVAKMTYQYLYEVNFFEGTDYFNEDDIEITFPMAKLKRDISLDGVFYSQNNNPNGGTMTGKSEVYNSDLSSDVLNSGLWSQKYYGTINEFKVDFAKSSYSFCRITGDKLISGNKVGLKPALDLGSLIVKKFYRKLNLIEFEYSKKVPFIASQKVIFGGKKYVIASQELRSNKKNYIKLLEV